MLFAYYLSYIAIMHRTNQIMKFSSLRELKCGREREREKNKNLRLFQTKM